MIGKKISLIVETEFGKDNASPKPYPLCVESLDLTSTDEFEENNCINSLGADAGGDKDLIGSKQSGGMVLKATYENAYFALVMQYGVPVAVDNGDGTFTYTFSSSTECLPSYSIQALLEDRGDCADGATTAEFVERYNGVKANSLEITINKSKPKFNMSYEAGRYRASFKKSYDSTGAEEPTLTKVNEDDEVILANTPIVAKTASIKFNNSAYCKAGEVSIKSDNGLKTTDVICEVGTDITREKYETTIGVKGIFDPAMLPIIADNETASIGVKWVSGINSLEFVFAEVRGEFKSKPIKALEKVTLDETFTAVRLAGAERVKVVLVNTVNSYN